MELTSTPAELRAALAGAARIGLVPTMGALHAGHLSLLERARAENERVVLSVFVNPLQFGEAADFGRYSRNLERDAELAAGGGADVLFAPAAELMYPPGFATRVEVNGPAENFEGASRPGHFGGVATVVLKLLNLVRPTAAYFGEKDWQQLAVVRRTARDLNLDVNIVGCPTVREAGGLALSSRNSLLTPEQRERAAVLARALEAARRAYRDGERDAGQILKAAETVLAGEQAVQLDYLAVVDADLQPLDTIQNAVDARLLIAARLFGVRLIDNMSLTDETPSS